MQRARVQPELDAVARTHGHPRIDSGCDLVTADHPVEELVRAQPLHDVDLHLEGRGAVDHAVGHGFWTEPERALLRSDRLGQLSSKPEAFADPLVTVAGTKFIVGVPMKPATKRFAGWS